MGIVFFGNERLATGVSTDVPVLSALIDAGYHIHAVVTHYETTKSRNARDLEIASVAEAHGIPVLLPHKMRDIEEQLRSYAADAGVLVAFGKILPQSTIDIFPHGIINIHPSLLPKHRGPTPLESVMLAGETNTGVSIMALSKEMDAGGIYAQSEVALSGTETKQQLADTLLDVGKSMLLEVLPGILDGSIVAVPQDDSAASYDVMLAKADGVLDFSKSAQQLEREIRAYALWPQSRTKLGNLDVIITAAHVVPGSSGAGKITVDTDIPALELHCSTDRLCVDKLKPAGKGEMPIAAFLNGYKAKLNLA